ncbi:ASCH domain-containing protein [Enterococcus sp. DIV0876]|uniref:ASCH domain-containing protein n=1 Tax=Enterococcus sp. DIV0876 TaxID=2774633 RepID=UPI003D300918
MGEKNLIEKTTFAAKVHQFWQRFLKNNPDLPTDFAYEEPWAFGNSAEMADDLAQLVLAGKKTATTSAAELYTLENEPLPKAGTYSILLNGRQEPCGVIYTETVVVRPFNEVSAAFAYMEGEGDRSLSYWRAEHEAYFKAAYQGTGLSFHQQIPCVCETFRCVYQETDQI